jgi:hypothetical protein
MLFAADAFEHVRMRYFDEKVIKKAVFRVFFALKTLIFDRF